MNKITLSVPTLILGAGISGSSSSNFFKLLTEYVYDCFIIDKDTINDSMLLMPNKDDIGIKIYGLSGQPIPRDSEYYQDNVRLQSYHCMLQLAKDNLKRGKHPILDAPYVKEIQQGYLDQIVFPFFEKERFQHKIKLIVCYADENTIKQRLIERNLPRDFKKLQNWEEFLEKEPILPSNLEKYDHIKIDTTKSLEDNIKKALEYLVT